MSDFYRYFDGYESQTISSQDEPVKCDLVIIDGKLATYSPPSNVTHLVCDKTNIESDEIIDHVYMYEPTFVPKTKHATISIKMDHHVFFGPVVHVPKFSCPDLESLSLVESYEKDLRHKVFSTNTVTSSLSVCIGTGPIGKQGPGLIGPVGPIGIQGPTGPRPVPSTIDLSHLHVKEMYIGSHHVQPHIVPPKGIKKLTCDTRDILYQLDWLLLDEIEEIHLMISIPYPEHWYNDFRKSFPNLRTFKNGDQVFGDSDLFSLCK